MKRRLMPLDIDALFCDRPELLAYTQAFEFSLPKGTYRLDVTAMSGKKPESSDLRVFPDRELVIRGDRKNIDLGTLELQDDLPTPAFDDALRMALQSFKTIDVSHRHMIILTNGDPSLVNGDILTQFRDAEIAISVVHIELHGPRYEAVPKQIAEMTGGDYYHVLNAKPSQIEPIYRRELSRLLHSPHQTAEETRAIFANPASSDAERDDAPSIDESVERGMQIDRLQRERRLVEPIENRMKALDPAKGPENGR